MSTVSKEMRRAGKAYAPLYRRANVALDVCAYCGAPRQSLDHVPPLSWVASIDLKEFRKAGGALLLYPACSLCNSLLNNRPLFYYPERVAWLYEKYMRMVDKETNLWTEEEIEELGYSLQVMVRARKHYLAELITKLRGVEQNVLNASNADLGAQF